MRRIGEELVKNEKKKKEGKDSQLILRLDREDRDAFVALCKDMDTTASREVRRFIRDFLKRHG
ncbi:hypothetical protein [Sagittula sp. S175]|uniref:hypothetical protein n=1 Tax=Sagittula sp. S175 TaxID=3415129 RepID=UPI003C7B46F7